MFVFLITESLASVLEKPVGNSNAKCLTEAFTVIKIQTKHKLIFFKLVFDENSTLQKRELYMHGLF